MVKINNCIKLFREQYLIIFILSLKETQSNPQKQEPEDDIDEPESETTLFIKNINFNTIEENITKVIKNNIKMYNLYLLQLICSILNLVEKLPMLQLLEKKTLVIQDNYFQWAMDSSNFIDRNHLMKL